MASRISSNLGAGKVVGSPLGGSKNRNAKTPCHRIFLLSPANASGPRAKAILQQSMRSELVARICCEGAPLGEIFSFISGLYFRGKLAYARAFAAPPPHVPGIFVITASGGLVSPDKILNIENLREISSAEIDPRDVRYRTPLLRDAQRICARLSSDCEVVLLGSIATQKYVEPLLTIFGERLLFPADFVGRGDMSRGGLMLRCQRAGVQLNYVPVISAVLHGSRPPRLPKTKAAAAHISPASR
ncbi:MAG TPA: hypothetical protein VFW94_05105 [Candidatus Acidoferrales bacterium]|nr:hypothetical protein [Candidatus Acidoferrales bacterium]